MKSSAADIQVNQTNTANLATDGLHILAVTLTEVKSRFRTPEQLHLILYFTRFLRLFDWLRYAHFQRWNLSGEESLARHPS